MCMYIYIYIYTYVYTCILNTNVYHSIVYVKLYSRLCPGPRQVADERKREGKAHVDHRDEVWPMYKHMYTMCMHIYIYI